MNTLRFVILSVILAASLGACSSAGKCRRGEIGCACQTGNSCEPGAQCVAERCRKIGASAGAGGVSGGGGRDSIAGRDAPNVCSAGSFDAACRSFCVAFCENQSAFCEQSVCPPRYCESASYTTEVQPACEQSCGDDPLCVRGMCLDQRRTTCETFWFDVDGGFTPGCFRNDPTCELDR